VLLDQVVHAGGDVGERREDSRLVDDPIVERRRLEEQHERVIAV